MFCFLTQIWHLRFILPTFSNSTLFIQSLNHFSFYNSLSRWSFLSPLLSLLQFSIFQSLGPRPYPPKFPRAYNRDHCNTGKCRFLRVQTFRIKALRIGSWRPTLLPSTHFNMPENSSHFLIWTKCGWNANVHWPCFALLPSQVCPDQTAPCFRIEH